MSRSVSAIITDDLDGSANAQTVTFGYDGVTYEIDLGAKNRARLENTLVPYIKAGRPAKRRGRRRSASRQGGAQVDGAAVRAWAKAADLKISERGRISAEVIRQYQAIH